MGCWSDSLDSELQCGTDSSWGAEREPPPTPEHVENPYMVVTWLPRLHNMAWGGICTDVHGSYFWKGQKTGFEKCSRWEHYSLFTLEAVVLLLVSLVFWEHLLQAEGGWQGESLFGNQVRAGGAFTEDSQRISSKNSTSDMTEWWFCFHDNSSTNFTFPPLVSKSTSDKQNAHQLSIYR